jgi:predicted amidohydrolase YtcJ
MKILVATILAFTGVSSVCTAQVADIVYTNAKIYTVNEAQPWAEAVAIKEGRFIKVGTVNDVKALIGDETEVVDLRGGFAMPGIVDMHAHPFSGIEMGTGSINLTEPGNRDAILQAIKDYAAQNPDKPFYMGGNWNIGGMFENDSPDKKLLDEIVPDIPVFLLSQSGHSAWVNSKALEKAGIDENFQNTGAYIFDRYPGTNEPSGTVRESAMVLITSALGYMPPEEFAPYLPAEIERYSRFGVTAIQTAEGSRTWLQAAAAVEKKGNLNVRLFTALDWLTSQLRALDDDETRKFIDDWESYQTEQIHPHYVKIFADGAADSHTLLMKEPYTNKPDSKGSMYLPLEDYRKAILDYYSRGITVHVHSMGDATTDNIVGIFEEAERKFPDSKATLHLAHCTLIDDEEFDRLKQLKKVTLNFSPMLAVPHPQMKLFFTDPIGEKRHQQLFPVSTALNHGLTVGFGSDFPSSLVPEPNQFWYMQGWVTRAVPGEAGHGVLNENLAVTVEQAIRGFTLGGAEALGYEYANEIGSIEVGKSADMIVLDRNLFESPANEIHLTEVDYTIFRGRRVFDRNAAVAALDVIEVEITNPNLRDAVDADDLNLLVEDDRCNGGCTCFSKLRQVGVPPGSVDAPAEVTLAFGNLLESGYRFARPARQVDWKDEGTYWIQWTLKRPGTAVLWAYDPEAKEAVEILQVREK